MGKKLVSVIIPTYKRPSNLSRAISSVLNQKYEKIEIIVVDDNNPNTKYRQETEELMEKYSDLSNVHYLKHPKNKNGSAARNTGFRSSKGEYIMFLDDDDEFINNKIESQVKKMESLNSNWGASYTGYLRKKKGEVIMSSSERREGSLLYDQLGRNLFIHAGSNLMVRRKVVEELDGFDEGFERNQDVEFLVRILLKYNLAYVDEVGLITHQDQELHGKRNFDFEEITSTYLEKFSNIIDNLEEKEKRKVYTLINLQLVRYYLSNAQYNKAIKFIFKNKLNLIIVIKYLGHLFNRAITKKAYGFKL